MHEKIICKYSCDKQWQELRPIPQQPDKRFCLDCRKTVYHCTTEQQAREHAISENCIMLPGQLALKLGFTDRDRVVMGMPYIPSEKGSRDHTDAESDYLDIPAFLKRQADD